MKRRLVIPMQFLLAQGEDAAQHHFTDAFRVGLRIGERQRRSPRTAEHQPLIDAGHVAQPLDISHQMPVVLLSELACGRERPQPR